MGKLSLVDRIEVYATSGTAVTIPADAAMHVARVLRAADKMAKNAKEAPEMSSVPDTAIKRWAHRNSFALGALWAFFCSFLIWCLS